MKTTIDNIYNVRTAENTSAVEAALKANAEAIRDAIIEIETKRDGNAIVAEFTQGDEGIEFTCTIIDVATAVKLARSSKEADAHDKVEIFIIRHSDADAAHTTEEFAEEHTNDVLYMIEYFMSEYRHAFIL